MTRAKRNSPAVDLIGVPVDFGANQRGVGMAPTAFRLAGLKDKAAEEGFDLRDLGDISPPAAGGRSEPQTLAPIRQVCTRLAALTSGSLKEGRRPLVVGGDHSLAIGTIAGAARHFRSRKQKMGLLWVDAHGDMNTPATSPSGNSPGRPLAISLSE